MNASSLSSWVDGLQARGRYSFLRQEAIDSTGLSAESVKKTLQRLVKRHRVVRVKDYFYVVVPTEYIHAGSPPVSWFLPELMRAMGQPYYVGLLSAAALHGASHHQPQEFQVITNVSQRPLEVARQRIRFFVKRRIEETAVTDVKTPAGYVRVSTPEATALDLVRFTKAVGYLGNTATVLGDLAERIEPEALLEAVKKEGHLPTAQRLGFLLDLVQPNPVADPLAAYIAQRLPRAVPLRTDREASGAPQDDRWRVFVNETVEAEV